MSMKADFNLVVGANQSLSYAEMKDDLKNIIRAINKQPYKIKLGFDMASASKDVNKIKADLKDLSQKAADIKFSDRISNSLSGITTSLKTLTDSVAGITGLKEELLSLSEAMRSFQGITIDIKTGGNNPVKRMAEYGTEARAVISDLKTQIAQVGVELEAALGTNKVSKYGIQSLAGILSAFGDNGSVKNLTSIGNTLGNESASLTKQMDAIRQYVALVQEVTSYHSLSVSLLRISV